MVKGEEVGGVKIKGQKNQPWKTLDKYITSEDRGPLLHTWLHTSPQHAGKSILMMLTVTHITN